MPIASAQSLLGSLRLTVFEVTVTSGPVSLRVTSCILDSEPESESAVHTLAHARARARAHSHTHTPHLNKRSGIVMHLANWKLALVQVKLPTASDSTQQSRGPG
jgi:hypothetical protein